MVIEWVWVCTLSVYCFHRKTLCHNITRMTLELIDVNMKIHL